MTINGMVGGRISSVKVDVGVVLTLILILILTLIGFVKVDVGVVVAWWSQRVVNILTFATSVQGNLCM